MAGLSGMPSVMTGFLMRGLIETLPMTALILCRLVRFQVSFPLLRRLGIQYIDRSGSLARRSNSVAHISDLHTLGCFCLVVSV